MNMPKRWKNPQTEHQKSNPKNLKKVKSVIAEYQRKLRSQNNTIKGFDFIEENKRGYLN